MKLQINRHTRVALQAIVKYARRQKRQNRIARQLICIFILFFWLQKTQPYCVEFGNKEAVRCEWDDPELADKKNQTAFYEDDAISLPSFRACPRVKSVERARFIKFEVRFLQFLHKNSDLVDFNQFLSRHGTQLQLCPRQQFLLGDKERQRANNTGDQHNELALRLYKNQTNCYLYYKSLNKNISWLYFGKK